MSKPAQNSEEPASLIERTAELLSKDSRTLLEISQGAELPFHWLKSFKDEPRAGASATRVQKLYEYLTGKSLKV